jgi:hypothetical protein
LWSWWSAFSASECSPYWPICRRAQLPNWLLLAETHQRALDLHARQAVLCSALKTDTKLTCWHKVANTLLHLGALRVPGGA